MPANTETNPQRNPFTETNPLRNPLLQDNDHNTECSPCCECIGFAFGLAFLGTLIWYASTHEASDEEQEIKRRTTTEPNNHANLLFMAAVSVIAFSAAYQVVNRLVSLSSLFHTRQKLPNTTKENKTNEQGFTPSNHQV